MPLHPAQVSRFVVTEAQEALQLFALEHLDAWIEVDIEPLAVVLVEHSLRHIHFNAAKGIGHLVDGRQIQLEMPLDRLPQQGAHLLLHRRWPHQAQEGVGLEHAVVGGFHVGISRHLGDAGDAVLDLHRCHHIGVAAHHIGAKHQHALLAQAERLEKAVELTLQLAQGSEGGAQGEGEAMLLAEDEAKGDTQAETPQREVSPLGCHGGLATINELGNLRQG